MNKWLLTAFLLTTSVAGFSQVSIGAQAGGVLSSPSIKSTDLFDQNIDAKSKFSWKAGLVFDVPFGEDGWRFMPELNYVNKGYSLDMSTSFLGETVSITGNSNIAYLELPLNVAYTLPLGSNNLVLGAGPYLGYALSGKNDFEAKVGGTSVTSEREDVEFGSDPGQIKRFEYGANFSAGYLLSGGLMLKANYNLGLTNISNEGNGSSYKNNYFGLSAVYFFKRAGQ